MKNVIAYEVCVMFLSFFLFCLRVSVCAHTYRYEGSLHSQQGSFYLPNTGVLASTMKEDTSQLSAVIKMGWLDKNPPQGYNNDDA